MATGEVFTERAAFIAGLAGCELLPEEASYLAAYRPCGIILFSRNFSTTAQLRQLIEDARAAAGHANWLVLVDQEGGRVQRLRGGDWPDFPAAAAFGALYRQNAQAGLTAARLCSQWLAVKLRAAGINTNCAPCLDLPVPGADGIIGDRAYGVEPSIVSAVGSGVADGLMAGGVVPVIKHIPGHGRAGLDSHLALPIVDAEQETLAGTDFVPFTVLNGSPAAMSAHVTFSSIDAKAPASISRQVTQTIIRRDIGFDGLLMSDDVSMKALTGSTGERCSAVLGAGSDVVLHCNGVMAEMLDVAAVVPKLSGDALRRYRTCLEITRQVPEPVDEAMAEQALEMVRNAAHGSHENTATRAWGTI